MIFISIVAYGFPFFLGSIWSLVWVVLSMYLSTKIFVGCIGVAIYSLLPLRGKLSLISFLALASSVRRPRPLLLFFSPFRCLRFLPCYLHCSHCYVESPSSNRGSLHIGTSPYHAGESGLCSLWYFLLTGPSRTCNSAARIPEAYPSPLPLSASVSCIHGFIC